MARELECQICEWVGVDPHRVRDLKLVSSVSSGTVVTLGVIGDDPEQTVVREFAVAGRQFYERSPKGAA